MNENSNIKSIYTKIQKQLFYMIPEKWDNIYLYASVIERLGHLETGEMFFYYFPKGLLKKNPINSYEIPNRFNIDEEEYFKLASNLYDLIKRLRWEYREKGKRLWTNITIKVEKTKFTVELRYDNLATLDEESIEAKHLLWAYQNLKIPMESLSKHQKNLLMQELQKNMLKPEEVTVLSEVLYHNPIKNVVQYNKEKTVYVSEKSIDIIQERKSKNNIPKMKKIKGMHKPKELQGEVAENLLQEPIKTTSIKTQILNLGV